jgi:hypothetical protein
VTRGSRLSGSDKLRSRRGVGLQDGPEAVKGSRAARSSRTRSVARRVLSDTSSRRARDSSGMRCRTSVGAPWAGRGADASIETPSSVRNRRTRRWSTFPRSRRARLLCSSLSRMELVVDGCNESVRESRVTGRPGSAKGPHNAPSPPSWRGPAPALRAARGQPHPLSPRGRVAVAASGRSAASDPRQTSLLQECNGVCWLPICCRDTTTVAIYALYCSHCATVPVGHWPRGLRGSPGAARRCDARVRRRPEGGGEIPRRPRATT